MIYILCMALSLITKMPDMVVTRKEWDTYTEISVIGGNQCH